MTNQKKVELLLPAGDVQRGIVALDFGADAIYLGGKQYSLRARASNFEFDDIANIANYAHKLCKKIYLVTNIICHNSNYKNFEAFLKELMKFEPDGFICSDPYIISTISKLYPNKEIHISTQQSVSNSKAALFFKDNGASRVVLSREVTNDELKHMLTNLNKQIEVEIFIHGAVCVSYSGRCMISNNFCYRDANTGGCAQSCR
jgi:putative protease